MENRLDSLFKSSTMAHVSLAAFGLAALIMSIDGYSIPAVSHVSVSVNREIPFFVFMPALVAFFFVWTRSSNQARSLTPLALVASVLGCACLVAGDTPEVLNNRFLFVVTDSVVSIAQDVLMLFWIYTLSAYGARRCATAVSFGIMFYALLNATTLAIRPGLVIMVTHLLPLVSALCLVTFRMLNKDARPLAGEEADSLHIYPCTDANHRWPYFLISTFVPLACYSISFGALHFSWLDIQDGSGLSLAIQSGILIGSLLGGVIVLMFVYLFWARENIHILKAMLPMFIMLAFWLSSSNTETWVFVRLALLNVTHKLVYLLMWLTPFMFELGRNKMTPFFMSYVAFEIGKELSMFIPLGIGEPSTTTSVTIVLAVLMSCSILPSMFYNSLEKYAIGRAAIAQPVRVTRFRNAIQTIAEENALTPRESEILWYLGKGLTSAHIADRLCISAATAKTHQKNIYAKLRLHSQQDLILLIDSAIAEQYEQKEPETATSARGTAAE